MRSIDREPFVAGMEAQRERLAAALREGMPRAGWKVGLNVPEVLATLGLHHPGIGWIDGRRVLASGDAIAAPAGARLHIEPELVIRLGRRVAPDEPAEIARAAIVAVHPALEVVDYAQAADGVDAIVAHSMFHFATVLGAPRELADVVDLGERWPTLEATRERGVAPRRDLVHEDLGELVAFVASFLAAFDERLEANDVVLSGSFLARALRLRPGDEAVARFGPLGEVRVAIEPAGAVDPDAVPR